MDQNAPPPSEQPPPPSLDRLTALPDGILSDIISLLPTNTAVTTSVLSHRWRYLWTQLTSLHLDYLLLSLQTSKFYTVVDQLLTRLTSPFIRNFFIRPLYPRHQHFDPWLRHLCSRSIENIHIIAHRSDPNDARFSSFTLPNCIFQTQTLVCLQLPSLSFHYDLPVGTNNLIIKLPNLAILELCFGSSQCGFVANLVRSCPLLEDLTLKAAAKWIQEGRNGVVIDISCPNLKHLELNLFGAAMNTKVVIDTPKLNCFALYAFRLASCTFVNKPITLREALIHIYRLSPALLLSILPRISNVTVLNIGGRSFAMFEGCSLAFSNLTVLGLRFVGNIGEYSDGLDGFSFKSTSPSLLLRIKTIKIEIETVERGNNFKKLAEYLISNSPALEKLTFQFSPHSSLPERMLGIDLDLFSRNFPQCLIEFSEQHANE